MPPAKVSADPTDLALVRGLADVLNDTGLSEIELEREGLKIRVAKTLSAPQPTFHASATLPAALMVAPAAAANPGPAPAAVEDGEIVKSPMVGTVYLQAQPGSPPFVKAGDTVSEGQTVLLIEAMKTMNPITAPRAGKIVRLLVVDTQPVEYGEPLLVLG